MDESLQLKSHLEKLSNSSLMMLNVSVARQGYLLNLAILRIMRFCRNSLDNTAPGPFPNEWNRVRSRTESFGLALVYLLLAVPSSASMSLRLTTRMCALASVILFCPAS